MKKTVKILSVTLVLIFLILNTSVQASSFNFSATANKQAVKSGESIVVTMNISNVDMGNVGMNALAGYIEFDKQKFEEITSIEGSNGWTWTYNPTDGKFTGFMLSGAKGNQTVGTITLKVKADSVEGTTDIKLKNIESSDSTNDITTAGSTINIQIKKDETPSGGGDNPTSNGEGNDPISDGGQSGNQTSNNNMPYTGASEVIGIAIVIVTIITSIIYININKYRGI